MRKQELIYLHGLLACVRTYYEGRTGEPMSIPEYDDMGVQPTAIHVPKSLHKAAVFALARALASYRSPVTTDPPPDRPR
jgi:hypothetical protein